MAGCNEYGRAGGVTLTPSGDLIVTQAGAVISGLDIKGTVYYQGGECNDRKLQDYEARPGSVVNIISGVTGAVVQDCEIDGVGSNNDGSAWHLRPGHIPAQRHLQRRERHNAERRQLPYAGQLHPRPHGLRMPHYDGIRSTVVRPTYDQLQYGQRRLGQGRPKS